MILGQERAVSQFASAWATRKLHHAWLLAGPKGVGKASFAAAAARRVLAEAADPGFDLPRIESPSDHPMVKLIDAGSHPDMRLLERIENPKKPGTLYRDISIDQVRALSALFDFSPAMSDWRVAVIDTLDELNKESANALLKMLEEPPPNTIFFLVSHAPGKLLPTIRSRCRRLDFQVLDDDAMASILEREAPSLGEADRRRVIAMAGGSAGRAIAFGELGLAKLEDSALAILRDGDPTNARRSALAGELGKKGSADKYAAFLDFVPVMIAREARQLDGRKRERALAAYAGARQLAAVAPRVALDPAATAFQMGGFLASVAEAPSLKR